MTKDIQLTAEIPEDCANMRLDKALAQMFPEYSRSRLQSWIKNKQILVDGTALRGKDMVNSGQMVTVAANLPEPTLWQAEDSQLNVIFEDDTLMVINKPANQVVHPAAGNETGTLVGAILNHAPECAHLPRAGIIHRIDKDTTGLLAVPKTLAAHTSLVQQLQAREMKREYLALVRGLVIAGGSVDQPIGRHPSNRLKMAVVNSGKPAVTHYRVEQKWPHFTLLRVQLETGRTHQIRVHMAYLQHPIIGDQTYAGRHQLPKGISDTCRQALTEFKRQALHAAELAFQHPSSGERVHFSAPLPDDFSALLTILNEEKE